MQFRRDSPATPTLWVANQWGTTQGLSKVPVSVSVLESMGKGCGYYLRMRSHEERRDQRHRGPKHWLKRT